MGMMRGSSSSAFSVSLPAELTIPLLLSLGLDPSRPPGLPVSFCARQADRAWGRPLDYNDIKSFITSNQQDSEMNNKMVTSFKTIKR